MGRSPLSLGALVLLTAVALVSPPAAAAAEVLSPPGWAGTWEFTLTYRDRDTGQITAVDRITNDVCPREPLGFALFAGLTCESTATDTDLAVSCASESSTDTCRFHTAVQLDLRQTDNILSGTAAWSAAVTAGNCGLADASRTQDIEISAVRLSALPPGACAQSASLVQKFVAQPGAAVLSATPFADLDVEDADIDRKAFEIEGRFRLHPATDGVDPRREEVKLEVGAFHVTLPAGSFRLKSGKGRKPVEFEFDGRAGGARVEVKITALTGSRFDFRAQGEGARVGNRTDPVPVALTIGNDGGSVAVPARRHRGHGHDHGDHRDCDRDDHDGRGGHGRRDE